MNEKELNLLGDRMDALDVQLYDAEQAADVETQARLLRERAQTWREWGVLLDHAGRDSHGAVLAAMRDEQRADQLGGAR